MEPPKKKILIVRHGSTEYNDRDILQGCIDNPLNANGETEVKSLSEYLCNETIDVIYSSPLKRAMQTAEIINAHHGAPVRPLDIFREIDLGDWEGLNYQFVRTEYQSFHEKWIIDPALSIPGGESFLQVVERVESGLKDVLDADERSVLISGHATVNRALAAHLLAIPPSSARLFRMRNAALSRFLLYQNGADRRIVLDFWNNTSYLGKTT